MWFFFHLQEIERKDKSLSPIFQIKKSELCMKNEIERRLHRVKISLDKSNVECPYSKACDIATNCDRCHKFYRKCSIYLKNYIT